MNVVITGGAGFIGRHIAEYFQNRAEVTVIDTFRTGHRWNLKGVRCNLVKGSILDRDLVRHCMQSAQYVFHLAAMVSVPESISKPAECSELNTAGTLLVLEEAAQARVQKLVFSTSAAVYGDSPVVPKTEDMAPAPKTPYADTKLEGERLCDRFVREGLLQTVSLRYFNVFGPYQDPSSQYAAAIPKFIQNALSNEPIVVFGDGGQTRDFIFVRDVVAANVFFATESDETGVFNIASGQGIDIQSLAHCIRLGANSSSDVTHVPERPGDIRHSVGSIGKARGAGFLPSHDFREGLEQTIGFFRSVRQS